MALLVTTASSTTLPALASAEQPGSDGAAGDAFAGVLAGIGPAGEPAGRHAGEHERDESTEPADPPARPGGHRPAEGAGAAVAGAPLTGAQLTGAELAMLALLAPALPAATVALFNSGCAAAAALGTAGSGDAGMAPVAGSQAATGPAEQAAPQAQQAAAARPGQAVAAQAAAAASKAARLADSDEAPSPDVPGTGPVGSGPGEDTGSVRGAEQARGHGSETAPTSDHGAADTLGPTKAADPAKAAASTAIFELAQAALASDPATGAAGSTAPVTVPGAPTGQAATVPAMAAAPAGAAMPADVEAAADPTRPGSTVAGAPSAAYPGAHVLTRRPARGAAAEGGRPVGSADHAAGPAPVSSADHAAGPAPVSSGLPAEPVHGVATVPAGHPGTPAGDPSVSPAQAQPVAAGRPAASGSEHISRYPAAELPLAHQVSGPVLALRAGGDGSHQLIVALHPAELGPVNVHVRIAGDLMTIQLASTSETAHDALRDALPQLRSELQSAGLSSATLSLDLASGGSGGAGAFADPRQGAGEPSRPAAAVTGADPAPAALRSRTSGGRTTYHSSTGLDRWL